MQAEIERRTAWPLTGTALAPDLVGISLSTTVQLSGSATSADAASVLASASQAAADYINNLGVGETVESADVYLFYIGLRYQVLPVAQSNSASRVRPRSHRRRSPPTPVQGHHQLGFAVFAWSR